MAGAIPKKISAVEKQKIKAVLNDPVLWSQAFVQCYNPVKKITGPWVARWYQREMLRDESLKKVARCGRRTGKTETMVVDCLYKSNNNNNHRSLIITPYENQVRLIFTRLNELIDGSPRLARFVTRRTKNPYVIEWSNKSSIYGFTTGASSGNGGASIIFIVLL